MSLRDRVVYSRFFGRQILAPAVERGYEEYLQSGRTPPRAYAAMRKLYGCSDTEPFATLVARAGRERRPLDLPEPEGIAAAEVEAAVAALESDGCYVLGARLDEESCADLEATALAAPCTLIGPAGAPNRACFDPAAPVAIRYDLDEADILTSSTAQRIVADPSLLAIAQQYIGAAPIQDLVAMWWSAAIDGGPGSADAAAQQYHFDLDRLRFLKVFVYLTDVDDQHGPHMYGHWPGPYQRVRGPAAHLRCTRASGGSRDGPVTV